jgi:hypothetical protein
MEMNEEMLTDTGISTVMSSNLQFAQIINPLEVHLLHRLITKHHRHQLYSEFNESITLTKIKPSEL